MGIAGCGPSVTSGNQVTRSLIPGPGRGYLGTWLHGKCLYSRESSAASLLSGPSHGMEPAEVPIKAFGGRYKDDRFPKMRRLPGRAQLWSTLP